MKKSPDQKDELKSPLGFDTDNLLLHKVRLTLMPLSIAMIGACFGLISLAAYIYQSSKMQIVPYVITVDKQGAVIARDDVHGSNDIPEIALASDLSNFIEMLRLKSSDKQLMMHAIHTVYARLKPNSPALEVVDKFYNNHSYRQKNVNAEVTGIMRMSDSCFQIDWHETSNSSELDGQRQYLSARISYELVSTGQDFQSLKLNPLGIRITELVISPRSKNKGENKDA